MSAVDEKALRRQQRTEKRKALMEQKKQEYEQTIRYKNRLTEMLNFKQYILVKNILVLIFTFSIVYAMLSLMLNYQINVYAFIASPDFVGIIIIVVVVWVLWMMLQGKEFKAPEGQNNPFSSGGNKTQFNIPNPMMQPQQQRQLNMPNPFGQKSQQSQPRSYLPQQQPQQQQPQRRPQQPQRKPHLQQKPVQQKQTGSWFCSNCSKLNMGTLTCRFCGYKKQ
ncbi:MAG: hypothetical protein ACOC56_02640 [Atribacterota bacterium]